jgi:hypothetical protein
MQDAVTKHECVPKGGADVSHEQQREQRDANPVRLFEQV